MKHDSQNILGCVRLSDLAKTLSNKLDLRIGEKIITLSNLSIYYTWKQKVHIITINLKYRHQHAIINLNYLMDCILYQIFRIILSIFKKKNGEDIDKPSVQIYVHKIGNRVTFKMKSLGHIKV